MCVFLLVPVETQQEMPCFCHSKLPSSATGEQRGMRSPREGTEQELFCKVENKIRIKAHLNYIYQRIFVNFMCFFFILIRF